MLRFCKTSSAALLAAAAIGAPSAAFAQNVEDCDGTETDVTTDLRTSELGARPGDDGSLEFAVPTTVFPDGIPFAGSDQTRFWININGNLSFNAADPTYTPDAIPGLGQPTIAPYFADLDLRDSDSGAGANPATVTVCEEPDAGRLMVTYRDVPAYDATDATDFDRRVTFQVVLRRLDGLCGEDDGLQVTFNYDRLDWYVGDASGGESGVCPDGASVPDECTPAVAGFDAGDGSTAVAVDDSRTTGIATSLLGEGSLSWVLDGGAVPVCGNGSVDGTCEECDDGGVDTSTCDFDCTFAVCGDGYRNDAAGEACDDGNTADGDGCSATCSVEEPPEDVGTDVGPDVGTDVGPDVGTDVGPDVGTDVGEDVAADVGSDAVDDADTDVPDTDVPDVDASDTTPDAGPVDAGDVPAVPDVDLRVDGAFSGGACNSNSVADGRASHTGFLLLVLGLVAARPRRRR